MTDFSVVIPVFNSERDIERTFNEVSSTLRSIMKSCEVIFVDDGSSDGSVETILNLQKHNAGVRLVRLRKNYGQYTATICGVARASGRHIITLDADGAPSVSVIALLAENMRQCSLQYAQPVESGREEFRKWGSRLFDGLVRRAAGNPAVLPCYSGSSLRMMSAELAQRAIACLRHPLMLDIVLMNLAKDNIRFVRVAVDRSFHASSYSNIRLVLLGIQLLYAIMIQRMFRVRVMNPEWHISAP